MSVINKKCSECGKIYDLSFFKKRRTRINNIYYYSYCIFCLKLKNKAYKEKNKDKISEYEKERYKKNSVKLNNNAKLYYQNNKEVVKEKIKKYQECNKERINKKNQIRKKIRKQTDPAYKLRLSVSGSIYLALKKQNVSKNNRSCLKYLPYNICELKQHLENQFEEWMNWNNWGVYNPKLWNDNDKSTWTWQIDHIIPQSKLLYTSMADENFKKCWALNNLRPLSSKRNILDKDRKG